MKSNRRRGNILLILFILFGTVLACTALLKLSISRMSLSEEKAVNAGEVNAYISAANICADTFRVDFESLYWLMTSADLEHMYGSGYGMEIYDQAIEKFQTALTRETLEDGSWRYHLTDPLLALEYAGIADEETLDYLTKLLTDASVELTIYNDIGVYDSENEEKDPMDDKGSVTIADIIFTVQLKKGAWEITQTYRLTGEKLVGRFGDGQNKFHIDGSDAVCQLERQTVTKNNREVN